MLWFLNLCAVNGIVVISYTDDAQGTMAEGEDGVRSSWNRRRLSRSGNVSSGNARRAFGEW